MLINCVAYQDGRKLADIELSARSSDYLARPDCFVWVALRTPTEAELDQMQEEFDLHELAVEDARHGHQRPKIEEYGDSLFVVLHTVELAGDELKVGEVDVFVGRNYVLSVRSRTERGFQDVRARARARARAAAARRRLRALRADGRGRRPLLPGARRPREPSSRSSRSRSSPAGSPREHRGALRPEAEADGAASTRSPLLEDVGKLYGGRVPSVRGHARVLPRRLRPPAPDQPAIDGNARW